MRGIPRTIGAFDDEGYRTPEGHRAAESYVRGLPPWRIVALFDENERLAAHIVELEKWNAERRAAEALMHERAREKDAHIASLTRELQTKESKS